MNLLSIKQSKEPESIKAEKCLLERVETSEQRTSEESHFLGETESGENQPLIGIGGGRLEWGTGTPEVESRSSQEPKETEREGEWGSERADAFKCTTPSAQTG